MVQVQHYNLGIFQSFFKYFIIHIFKQLKIIKKSIYSISYVPNTNFILAGG